MPPGKYWRMNPPLWCNHQFPKRSHHYLVLDSGLASRFSNIWHKLSKAPSVLSTWIVKEPMTFRYTPCFLVWSLAACQRPPTPSESQMEQSINASPATDTPVAREVPTTNSSKNADTADAKLEAAPRQTADGKLSFESTDQGVRVTGKLHAAPGPHGFHVHEIGDCSDIPGNSMGEHFSPDGHAHALPAEADHRHLGDLGNVVMDASGTAQVDLVIAGANLKDGDPHSIVGKAVVVHAKEDTGKTSQPAGDSGDPIACGVIKSS